MAGLTDRQIRALKPTEKPYRVSDSAGLYIEVVPGGGRYWRYKFRYAGREKRLAFGVFPAVSLAEARNKRDDARSQLRAGTDPSAVKRSIKLRAKAAGAESFEAVAREWLAQQKSKMAAATYAKANWMFEGLLFPWLGARPVGSITAAELLATFRRIEARGRYETAHRCKQRVGQVMRFAVATGRAQHDPSSDLRGALHPVVSAKRAAITDPVRVGQLLRAIDSYSGHFVTCCALKLSAMLFVRPGELRHAEWAEIDLDLAVWRIPGAKMKMRAEHVVPLPIQALKILRELQQLTGRGRYVFPGIRSVLRPMSENTTTAALRNMGYDRDTMTAHGFRAMASTLLNEMGWAPDVIERQLAHAERNRSRDAYNRAQYLAERRTMMQCWVDHLDQLRTGALVTPIGMAASHG